jgi:hypothetical protein
VIVVGFRYSVRCRDDTGSKGEAGHTISARPRRPGLLSRLTSLSCPKRRRVDPLRVCQGWQL